MIVKWLSDSQKLYWLLKEKLPYWPSRQISLEHKPLFGLFKGELLTSDDFDEPRSDFGDL